MSKLFDTVRVMRPKLNKFDLSHERKMSMNLGKIVPVAVQEIIPGDRFRWRTELLVRFAPLLAPIMHRVNCYVHCFYVPNRLVWSEWEDFITGGRLGDLFPVSPTLSFSDTTKAAAEPGTLADYMGVPAVPGLGTVSNPLEVSALPFRAYQLIYDEYFRDQNVTASIAVSKGSGPVNPLGVSNAEFIKLTTLRNRAWEKDYFTSALPFAQRGAAAVAPLSGNLDLSGVRTGDVRKKSDDSLAGTGAMSSTLGVAQVAGTGPVYMDLEGLGEGAITDGQMNITDLRRAIKLQEWTELAARVGGRYTEHLRGFWDEISDDARLQRPEFLGGSRTPVVISEVLGTNQDDLALPLGEMAGHGIGVGGGYAFSKKFKEHGYVICVMSVLPKTAYQQGVPKHLSRFGDKFEHYFPQFAHLGEQEVLQRELYYDYLGTGQDPDFTFGYQSRFAEMKQNFSSVHGDFKTTLAFWHMGRIFDDGGQPALNTEFIESSPTYRVFAETDPDVHHLWCQVYHDVSALRKMPLYGTPMI